METTYRQWERRRRESGRRTTARRQNGSEAVLGIREKRRLAQLIICVALFLVVFIGKGVFPDKISAVREQLLNTLQSDTDFEAAFASLGRSISAGEPMLDTLGGLWVDVFGGEPVAVSRPLALEQMPTCQAQIAFLTARQESLSAHWLSPLAEQETEEVPKTEAVPEPAPAPTPAPEPEVPAVEHVDYDGPALPDNATMDKYNLSVVGIGETATPALGWLTSGFGWREHPVDGEERFHNGVDLGVNTGTEVVAFADGTVDYIGDSPIYGLYLQIRHAGDVTTFYAHCSELCVQQGQTVQVGERVALSGATGNVTGPHLHFEIKLDGQLLNPIYYIETT